MRFGAGLRLFSARRAKSTACGGSAVATHSGQTQNEVERCASTTRSMQRMDRNSRHFYIETCWSSWSDSWSGALVETTRGFLPRLDCADFARPTFGTSTNTTVLYFQCSISSAPSLSTVGISLKLRELGQSIGSEAGQRCKHSRIQAVGQGQGHLQLQQYFVS